MYSYYIVQDQHFLILSNYSAELFQSVKCSGSKATLYTMLWWISDISSGKKSVCCSVNCVLILPSQEMCIWTFNKFSGRHICPFCTSYETLSIKL